MLLELSVQRMVGEHVTQVADSLDVDDARCIGIPSTAVWPQEEVPIKTGVGAAKRTAIVGIEIVNENEVLGSRGSENAEDGVEAAIPVNLLLTTRGQRDRSFDTNRAYVALGQVKPKEK